MPEIRQVGNVGTFATRQDRKMSERSDKIRETIANP